MTQQQQHSDDKADSPMGKEQPGESGDVSEDSCRCKEVSKKTFPEMLKLMISDLAFWKKTKGRK